MAHGKGRPRIDNLTKDIGILVQNQGFILLTFHTMPMPKILIDRC